MKKEELNKEQLNKVSGGGRDGRDGALLYDENTDTVAGPIETNIWFKPVDENTEPNNTEAGPNNIFGN